MYVCICNQITTSMVESAIRRGCTTPEQVHEHHGCEPGCCSCFLDMDEMMEQKTKKLQDLLCDSDLDQLGQIVFPTSPHSVKVSVLENTIAFSSIGIYGTIVLTHELHLDSVGLSCVPISKVVNFLRDKDVTISEEY